MCFSVSIVAVLRVLKPASKKERRAGKQGRGIQDTEKMSEISIACGRGNYKIKYLGLEDS